MAPIPVLVDFDSTLNQFDQHFCDAIDTAFGIKINPEDCTHWNHMRDQMTPEQNDHMWGTVWDSEDFTLGIQPQEDAVTGLNLLLENNIAPQIVTDRKAHMQAWIWTWLENLGLRGIPVHTSDYRIAPKYTYVWKYNMKAAIEDSPHNSVAIARKNAIPVFLIDKPWNQDVRDHANIYRVASFYEACEAIVERFKPFESRVHWT